jgi:hypothetical protein
LKANLTVALLLCFFSGFAQKFFQNQPEWDRSSHLLSYYGDMATRPGIFYAFEYAFINSVKTKVKVRRNREVFKYKTRRLELVPNVSFYVHPKSHIGFIPNVSLQYKKINHRRWMMNMGIGIGAFFNYLPDVYTVVDNRVEDPKGMLNHYAAPSIYWSFGRVKNRNNRISSLDFGIKNHFLLDFNHSFQLAPALTVGYRF